MRIYKSAEEMIGKTPLLLSSRLMKKFSIDANIFAKIESFNPCGSIKDRAALFMILDAEQKGILKKGATIIEPTSGNTGIGLSFVATLRGYKCIIVMPDSMSEERKKLMRAYGAELVLTDGRLGMGGAIEKANELNAEIPGSFLAGQFENEANKKAHFNTTGPEIWEDTEGKVDIVVATIGTGGTISGIGEFLKAKNPDIKIIGVEPDSSAVLSGEAPGSHKIQGIGAGFVPKVLNTKIYDEIVRVTDDEAFCMAREFLKTEGVLAGISSGAALSAAVKIAKKNKDKNIVVILPDTGTRYLSGDLF